MIHREMKKIDTNFQTPTKQRLNNTKEHNNAHKNILKEEIMQVITENFRGCYYTWSSKMYKRQLRKSKMPKTPKIKNRRRYRNK
jgi:hypothetical protein